MSRKLTLLQVNDNVLSRKQQLLQEREAGLRKVCDIIISLFVCSEVYMLVVYIHTYLRLCIQENSQLHHDKVWIEKAVTEKIAYLQRHKVCTYVVQGFIQGVGKLGLTKLKKKILGT